MFSLKGKTAIVTGGSSGIGAACVEDLLKMGVVKCAIFDIDVKRGEEMIKNFDQKYKDRVKVFKCDVSKMNEFEEAMKKTKEMFKNIDILINNAAICDEQNWEKMIEVNLIGTANGTKLGLKYMGKDNGGSGGTIVNMSSVAGLSFSGGFPIYCATNYGIIGLSRSYSEPYYFKKSDVRIMVICIGFTDTDLFLKHSNTQDKDLAQEQKKELNYYPFQKKLHVAQSLSETLIHGEHNSIWVCEGGQDVYEILKPNRVELKKVLTED